MIAKKTRDGVIVIKRCYGLGLLHQWRICARKGAVSKGFRGSGGSPLSNAINGYNVRMKSFTKRVLLDTIR
jgi:hypothetical protein